jgi:hypothetical protein
MSSVTSFIRQIPLATTYYTCVSGTQPFFDFYPTTTNYVGNYPPGFMVANSLNIGTLGAGAILRDMGKTIKADVSGALGSFGYFREVQVLVPTTFAEGCLGGISGNTGGVIGSPSVPTTYSPYYTLYVRTTVAGLGPANPGITPIIGGQM